MKNALDLYCGGGGVSHGLKLGGFNKVVGVDIKYQPYYPFEFIHNDVFDIDIDYIKTFDFVWSSPPCQSYTFASKKSRNLGKEYPDLIKDTRNLLLKVGKPFVIENVISAPIQNDLLLCGEMFGLRVIRHRIFEIHGFEVYQPHHRTHKGSVKDGYYMTVAGHGGDGKASLSDWQRAMGIDWIFDKKQLAEAIPPAYSHYISMFYIHKDKSINKIYNKAIRETSNHKYNQASIQI